MPLVSIIIPVYNVETKLEKCLSSVMNQTIKDIEIILINDGSTDSSGDICDNFSSKDSRFKCKHIINSGVSVARNTGTELATTDNIIFIDSDDFVDSNFVKVLYETSINNGSDFVMCGYKRHDEQNKNTKLIICESLTCNTKMFVDKIETYISPPLLQGPCWKLFKKNIITQNNITFPKDMSYGEDTFFVYKYLKSAKSVTAVNECLYTYITYDNKSLSKKFRNDKLEIELLLIDKLKELLSFYVSDKETFIKKQICGKYIEFVGEMFRYSKIDRNKRLENIKIANKNEELKRAFENLSSSSLQYKIIDYLLRNNSPKSIDLFFMIKEKLRILIR